MPEELGFNITGVNTATLVYSIAFTVITLITNPIAKRIGPHKWIPFLMFSWAVTTWSHIFLRVCLSTNSKFINELIIFGNNEKCRIMVDILSYVFLLPLLKPALFPPVYYTSLLGTRLQNLLRVFLGFGASNLLLLPFLG